MNRKIKAIVFDFDGVIVNSIDLKGWCFMSLFKKDYPLKNILDLGIYHLKYKGRSRYDKIGQFLSYFQDDVSEEKINYYAEQYSKCVQNNLNKKHIICDTLEYIKANNENYNFYIASNSDEKELKLLCDRLEISQYFKGIFGLPIKKSDIIAQIIHKMNYSKSEIILIGDSQNDIDAAESNKIKCFGFNNEDLRGRFDEYIITFKEHFE